MAKEYVYLIILLLYFLMLLLISFFTGRNSHNEEFFTAGRKSPWYLVAFGMIGASLSGVTFISVPGWVGSTQMTYMQIVIGYFVGYIIIAKILLPLYYQLEQPSIYAFLETRYGTIARKTGGMFFLFSRLLGSSIRMYLTISVLHLTIFRHFQVPFEASVLIGVLLVWLYTYRGGIKTIVFTDTFQTFFMLFSVVITIFLMAHQLRWGFSDMVRELTHSKYWNFFELKDINSPRYFLKQIFSGMLITLTMTGLDQDMMQKNLTCKNVKEAQKNMYWFSVILVLVNFLFLFMGALLYLYADHNQITLPEKSDEMFPMIATGDAMPRIAGVIFVLGLVAAAYSSADSALTALTTSFFHDILSLDKRIKKEKQEIARKRLHIMFTLLTVLIIILFAKVHQSNVIDAVLKLAGYTYGPLLGLYGYGLLTKKRVKDGMVPWICLVAPVIGYCIQTYSARWLDGYQIGYEILAINALLTSAGLWIIRSR